MNKYLNARLSLGLTKARVSRDTGIAEWTIKRIEEGQKARKSTIDLIDKYYMNPTIKEEVLNMATEKKVQIAIVVPVKAKYDKAEIARQAEKLGMTLSEFCYAAVENFMDMTPSGVKRIKEYADTFRLSMGVALENTTLNEIAKNDARKMVFGSSGKIRVEFASSADGLFQGDALYRILFNKYYRMALEQRKKMEAPDETV